MYSEHPIPDNLRTMADRFEELADAQKVLDFSEPRVAQCGTVACHGGWAGVILAADVGDSCGYDLLRWADQNPELWGNPWGAKMFGSDGYFAFNIKSPAISCTLQHIADHYREVAARIRGVRYVLKRATYGPQAPHVRRVPPAVVV